ncbi:DUF262 domain-containing HNH endonuclease family protein [Fulvimarina sp. MAC8]|uniref:DUF262 domain-containing protein n=1 Tax=Fulvimarina sp. MAC8 TaxID=3162874 RepID=UPI0032F09905
MIRASETAIGKIFDGSYQFLIPYFQRPYAWTTVETLQLLADVKEAMESTFPGQETEYFLGSTVLIKQEGSPEADVVDGQQRLTTLTLLLAALRDCHEDEQYKIADGKCVLVPPNPAEGVMNETIRLRQHTEDHDFLNKQVQCPPEKRNSLRTPQTDAQRNIQDNYFSILSEIRKWSRKTRERFSVYLRIHCKMVTVRVETQDAALRIFRVLNDRGMALSNADIIKADLLNRVDAHQKEPLAAKWRDIETEIGRNELEELLAAFQFISDREKLRQNLSDAYQRLFASSVGYFASPQDFVLNYLDRFATHFEFALLRSKSINTLDGVPSKDGIIEALSRLKLLPNRDWLPLALYALDELGNRPQVLAEIMDKIEKLAWRMQLARMYDTQRRRRYAECIHSIEGYVQGERDIAFVDDLMSATDIEKISVWTTINGDFYNHTSRGAVRAALVRLDWILSDQKVTSNKNPTVEHILPQNPRNEEWTQFSEAERQFWTHRLGNLVLLSGSKNSSASRNPFPQKKAQYFGLDGASSPTRTTYAQMQELAPHADWTLDLLKERHDRLARRLAGSLGIDHSPLRTASDDFVDHQISASLPTMVEAQ